MTSIVEIKMTTRGYDVTFGKQTTSFSHMSEALEYAQRWLRRAAEIRDISMRCE